MQSGPGRIADGDAPLFAARRAPRRVECVFEVNEHRTGIIEENPPGVGQLHTSRLASK